MSQTAGTQTSATSVSSPPLAKTLSDMLLIHWSQHNQTTTILKNGIRLSGKSIKGVWCFPYSRNKSLNANWKAFLKRDRGCSNYNGFVFRLEKEDFPIYAGDFGIIAMNPEARKFQSYEQFVSRYGKYFNPRTLAMESTEDKEWGPDYGDFEIILSKSIEPERIIKVIKDREAKVKFKHG